MSEAKKKDSYLCQKCGGVGSLGKFVLGDEMRWQVRCTRCKRMTMHYAIADLASKEWAAMQRETREERFLGEG